MTRKSDDIKSVFYVKKPGFETVNKNFRAAINHFNALAHKDNIKALIESIKSGGKTMNTS